MRYRLSPGCPSIRVEPRRGRSARCAISTQREKAEKFHSLHVKGDPVVLYNIWDPGSASVVAEAGARALATGSAPVAMSQGYRDGEHIPLQTALANVQRIVEQTDLPVSLDFEGGYAAEPSEIKANVARALATGVVGINFEDQIVGTSELYEPSIQAARIAAAREAVEESGAGAFLNCRTDLFLKNAREQHDAAMLKLAIERAGVFASAGADGFFAPGLVDESLIGELCEAVQLPVNIIALPGCPPKATLARLGVARLSYGPVAYKQLMAKLGEAAKQALSD